MQKALRRRGRDVLELVDEPGDPGRATDRELQAVRAPESFESFYRREYPRLLVLARALAGDRAAEDVAQETMVVTYRRWTSIATYDSPVGYVRGICAHTAVSAVRRAITERRAVARLASRRSADIEQLPAADELFWTEVRRLPRRQAQVVALYYALDASVAEIAGTLGCAEGTVKVHLSRARAALAERLSDTELDTDTGPLTTPEPSDRRGTEDPS